MRANTNKKPYKWEITLDRMHLSPATTKGYFCELLKSVNYLNLSFFWYRSLRITISQVPFFVFSFALLLTACFRTFYQPKVIRSLFWKPFFTSFQIFICTLESSFLWFKYTTFFCDFQSAILYEKGSFPLCKRYIYITICWKLLTLST